MQPEFIWRGMCVDTLLSGYVIYYGHVPIKQYIDLCVAICIECSMYVVLAPKSYSLSLPLSICISILLSSCLALALYFLLVQLTFLNLDSNLSIMLLARTNFHRIEIKSLCVCVQVCLYIMEMMIFFLSYFSHWLLQHSLIYRLLFLHNTELKKTSTLRSR